MDKKPAKNKPALSRIFALQKFLQNFHDIERVVHHPGSATKLETDTEHSYSLAMVAWYLAQYFPELDTAVCIRLSLVHDLVEVYAGDTYFYGDQVLLDSKAERELEALQQIEREWPDFLELINDIKHYEALDSPESCFVYALDKIMPIIMIFLGEGHTWKQENITLNMLKDKKKEKVAKSPEINHYFQELLTILEENPQYFPEKVAL